MSAPKLLGRALASARKAQVRLSGRVGAGFNRHRWDEALSHANRAVNALSDAIDALNDGRREKP